MGYFMVTDGLPSDSRLYFGNLRPVKTEPQYKVLTSSAFVSFLDTNARSSTI